MQYLFLIYEEEAPGGAGPDQAEMAADLPLYAAFTRETRERKQYLAGEALQPTSTATSVRVRDGRSTVTDGPFAETKEALGGFYLLDCRDIDEAIEMAAKIPSARRGTIEVRPVWELPAAYTEAGGS
ncbi:MAG TPA: YciI family protein [Candidatus Sulfomarinibacteraceae bacterium]|nr:YciI family protein [Candidatus Sulfomarinibacteraceae bacterium]